MRILEIPFSQKKKNFKNIYRLLWVSWYYLKIILKDYTSFIREKTYN